MEKLFIIKIGGNIIDDNSALNSFLLDLSKISAKKILVHGGGKIASRIGEQLGITAHYHNGRRITDDKTIDLVTMVYGGLVNKQIVAKLQALHVNAIGLTGADGNVIAANKRPVKEVDYGWVGDIAPNAINHDFIANTLTQNLLPVFAPLTHDGYGHMLNTNADTIASALAIALSAQYYTRLIYCFEKKGILLDVDDNHSVITQMNKTLYADLMQQNRLFAGILPKLDNAFAAIDNGVHEVLIGDAKDLVANTGIQTKGTLIST